MQRGKFNGDVPATTAKPQQSDGEVRSGKNKTKNRSTNGKGAGAVNGVIMNE
jgi:hypothetical protein